MPSSRTGKKVGKGGSSSSSKRAIVSRHQPSEVTHVLLRELSTQKLVSIKINSLSYAARMKPLTSGRNVSFRDGNAKVRKQGEILIVGTHDEVAAEMNNHTRVNLTESPQKRQREDDSFEQNYYNKRRLVSNSSISSNVVETPFIRSPSSLSQDYAFRLPTPTVSALTTTITTTTNSLLSNCSTTSINETPIQDNMADADASIITPQQPLPSELSPLITTTLKTSINPSTSRTVVASTTITRTIAAGDALKEIKYLQSLVKSKDDEIAKLTEQVKKLKEEIEKNAEYSIFIPTDDVVVQWVDYLYESVHKEEIRNQLDLNTVAAGLGIERETLDLCLELSGTDRIITARQLFKHCINYDEAIQQEHCWQNIDEEIVIKICRFVREFFGVHIKFSDNYVRDSLASVMRKDSWKFRNPDKSKTKVKQSSTTSSKVSSKQGEEMHGGGDSNINYDEDDDDHF